MSACEGDKFNLIVSENAVEHIEDAESVAAERTRILRPGGFIFARTPNSYGYRGLLSGMIPNNLHERACTCAQPERNPADVIPTIHKMNSPTPLGALFIGCDVCHYYAIGEPPIFWR